MLETARGEERRFVTTINRYMAWFNRSLFVRNLLLGSILYKRYLVHPIFKTFRFFRIVIKHDVYGVSSFNQINSS